MELVVGDETGLLKGSHLTHPSKCTNYRNSLSFPAIRVGRSNVALRKWGEQSRERGVQSLRWRHNHIYQQVRQRGNVKMVAFFADNFSSHFSDAACVF